jgi:hypothetical protein
MTSILALQKMEAEQTPQAARWTILSWDCKTENSTLSKGC